MATPFTLLRQPAEMINKLAEGIERREFDGLHRKGEGSTSYDPAYEPPKV